MNVSPEMLSLAWRAFKGNRSHLSVGPGPGFKEAIEAIAPLIIEHCALVVLDEAVGTQSEHEEDKAYNMALSHAADALRALKDSE